ncbi:septation ring formation regulator EzrA [Virgibacillus kekensis]|uniref:Septation ring formation regulator EzrA n=1 Tax=Virgibacillus kekensis TaxID=202261 RepID=A0ABV9DD39_9BACI
MAYIIGTILVVITLIIVGLILRKRVYDVVDRLEAWKMDIMNRNIASQLARIKRLNLSGETQVKFESWKDRWEYIVTKELPDIEEFLFDAEEAADRYRFSGARKTLRKVEQTLESIENDIEQMLKELDELMDSEENSRKEIEQIEPALKGLRKSLSQNRYQFGKAEIRFEVEIDELSEQLAQYHELTESGDYYEAQNLVNELKSGIEDLEIRIKEFPAIYKKCKNDLPSELDELFKGLRDMKDNGYRIEHLGFEKEVHNYQRRLIDCVNTLEKGELTEAKTVAEEVDERIAEMYQLLEKEAIAKSYVETKIPGYEEALNSLESSFHITKDEVELLRQTYYFEDSDMEKYLSLEKSIVQLRNQLNELGTEIETKNSSHTELRAELENGLKLVDELQEKHEEFKKRIQNLRKDEVEAKEKLKEMKNELYLINRRLNKSNIPGVPRFIWNIMDEAVDKNNKVLKALEKQPLDITEVQHALSESKTAIDRVTEQTDLMLDQAFLTEQVIQYANRYRSNYPLLAAKLSESERLFRSYEYDLALEQAAKAVEEVEPGALKRIESFQVATN